jgi:ribonuclease BN (tRNA processing enzyme)
MFAIACSQAPAQPACPPAEGVAVQVLGSGGPIADDARSSTSYVIWVDGSSRALIDMGSGSFVRFGEAGARFTDLDFIGLSHFHTDHAADFVALLKSGNFSGRERPLPVAGPGGGAVFPGLEDFLAANLDKETGAYRYLGGYLDGSGGLARLLLSQIDDGAEQRNVLEGIDTELAVYAQHVPHGIVPAVAFRVDVRGRSLVFASDQNGSDPEFVEFARDAALLVMHLPVPENAGENARKLHAVPSRIGQIAAAANAERLLLSHFMARSLENLANNVAIVSEAFDGNLITADDLMCVDLG